MLILNALLRILVEKTGNDYLGCIRRGFFSGVIYGINRKTGLYSFWKLTDNGLVVLESDLDYNSAKFKFNILMNKGEDLC